MKTTGQCLTVAACASMMAASALAPAAGAEPDPIYTDADLAVNHPDEFAWRMFVEISRPVDPDGRYVQWETWASQDTIYNDPNTTPRWPTNPAPAKVMHPPTQQMMRMRGLSLPPIPPDQNPMSGMEEVHDNRPAFDYIVENQLWYQQGLIAAAQEPGGVDFPQEAVVVKAIWKFITAKQKPRYHWHAFELKGEPVIVGLVALHVSSKVLPNWHWATFEQVENPGLADYIGVHDRFGLEPSIIYPNPTPNQGYAGGKLTSAVTKLMKEKGLGPQWQHYRLKGAQIDFTNATGQPTLVGNSITEAGFVGTSSCITCHARTSIKSPVNGDASAPNALSVFTPHGQSHNGPVDPAWFWTGTADPATLARPEATYYPLDFLWQLGFFPKKRQ